MLALIAAILFALALLEELFKHTFGSIGVGTLEAAGLMLFALHFAYTRSWNGRR